MERSDGIRYFLWHATKDRPSTGTHVPYFCREIRELIWHACFPLVWMRCKTCHCAVLLINERSQLVSVRNRYFIIQGRALCDTCFEEKL